MSADVSLAEVRAFVAVVETGSSTEAALRLGVTQSAVSRQIRRMEERLGLLLFDRSHQRLRLTDSGRGFLPFARTTLSTFEETLSNLTSATNRLEGELRIAASTTPGDFLVPRWIETFVSLYPSVQSQLYVSDSAIVVQEVLDQSWDVGFTGGDPQTSALVSKVVAQDEVVLAVGADHPFAAKTEVELSELQGQTLIAREKGSATARTVSAALEARGIQLPERRVLMELNSTQASLTAVQKGLGLCWTSIRAFDSGLAAGLRPVRIKDLPLHRQIYLVYRKRGLPAVATEFVRWLENEVSGDQ